MGAFHCGLESHQASLEVEVHCSSNPTFCQSQNTPFDEISYDVVILLIEGKTYPQPPTDGQRVASFPSSFNDNNPSSKCGFPGHTG